MHLCMQKYFHIHICAYAHIHLHSNADIHTNIYICIQNIIRGMSYYSSFFSLVNSLILYIFNHYDQFLQHEHPQSRYKMVFASSSRTYVPIFTFLYRIYANNQENSQQSGLSITPSFMNMLLLTPLTALFNIHLTSILHLSYVFLIDNGQKAVHT